jgi:outer membrane immunogenic protein
MRHFTYRSAAILAALTATAASAADLPSRNLRVEAPVMASSPRWDGAYIGLNAGGAWGASEGTLIISSALLAMFPPIIPTINTAGSNRINLGGALLGAQAGYNFAIGDKFVLGVESDIAWTNLSGSVSTSGMVPVFNGPFGFNQRVSADWLATVRGRAGFAAFDDVLIYATGGLAVTRIRTSSDFADSFAEYEFYKNSATRLGWTVGAGLEYAFGPHWSAKLEYLHTEFPGISGMGSSVLADGSSALVYHNTRNLKTDSVRLGLNYRFAAGATAPLVAKY